MAYISEQSWNLGELYFCFHNSKSICSLFVHSFIQPAVMRISYITGTVLVTGTLQRTYIMKPSFIPFPQNQKKGTHCLLKTTMGQLNNNYTHLGCPTPPPHTHTHTHTHLTQEERDFESINSQFQREQKGR